MDRDNQTHNLWSDYLVIGAAVAILLTMLDYSRDSFYQIIPVVVLFFIAGMKDNLKVLDSFLRIFLPFFAIFVLYLLHYLYINVYVASAKFVTAMFFVTLGGYFVAKRCDGNQEKAYRKLWVILLTVILLGVSKMMIDAQTGYFMSYQTELEAAVIFAAITLLYIEDRRLKVTGVIVALVSAFLSIKNNAFSFNNILAIKEILPFYLGGGFRNMLIGRGQLVAHEVVADYSENTFASLLFDYGFILFTVYLAAFVFAVVMIVKSSDKLLKKQAILVCVMIVVSSIFSMLYWGNIIFLIWTGIGIMMGRYEYVRSSLG